MGFVIIATACNIFSTVRMEINILIILFYADILSRVMYGKSKNCLIYMLNYEKNIV